MILLWTALSTPAWGAPTRATPEPAGSRDESATGLAPASAAKTPAGDEASETVVARGKGIPRRASDGDARLIQLERGGASSRDREDGLSVTWRRFSWIDYGTTAALVAGYYAVEFSLQNPTSAPWTHPFPVIDEATRDTFVAHSRDQRMRAHKLSNTFWTLSVVFPVIESAVAPIVRRADRRVIWELEWMNFQQFVLASLVTRVPHKLIGRTRPNSVGCTDDPLYDEQCGKDIQYQSFPGGHTSISMTGAGLSCAHHVHAQLYGNPWADGIACGSALTVATLVSYWRIRADRHWISDNLVGAAMGLSIGYGVPTLFYYHPFWEKGSERREQRRQRRQRRQGRPNATGLVLPTPTGAFAVVSGTF